MSESTLQDLHSDLKPIIQAKVDEAKSEEDIYSVYDWFDDIMDLPRKEGAKAMLDAFGVDSEKYLSLLKGKRENQATITGIFQKIIEKRIDQIKGVDFGIKTK